jgi:hypothetical protein
VIGAPPLFGAAKVTVAWALPNVATALVGALGAVAGVTDALGPDALPSPTPFVAATVNVYTVPFVSPTTVIGLVVPVAV